MVTLIPFKTSTLNGGEGFFIVLKDKRKVIEVKKKPLLWACGILGSMGILLGTLFAFIWNGIILLNHPSMEEYPVRGVDVSSYQGKIDWQTLSSQNLSFAFIKATEGSSFVDPCFAYNYEEAQKTDLRIGAYHFFSYDSSGKNQAEHFISTVNKIEGMLPPVIDLEFYGDKEKNPPEPKVVRKQLDSMLKKLEDYYGQKPMIYATEKSYSLYLAGAYEEYDIWIRNVITGPSLADNREWTFWQYTNREKLKGYEGKEQYIDLNVFNGTLEEFAAYGK